ncbi:MAG: glycerol dehydrogenase [Saprospirales bacterium]|nr:MAG: glycerol dehydrogenase [Saprospirales bacterium]
MKNSSEKLQSESKSAQKLESAGTKYDKPFKSVFPGKYIQGEGLIEELPDTIKSFGDKGLILSSPTAKKVCLDKHSKRFAEDGIEVIEFKGECCASEIMRISDMVISNEINVLVGVGGGKAIDTAKIVADRAEIPVIVVPTIASTDAPCSGCAVIYSENGHFESVYYQKMNPQVVLVDMNVMSNAPTRFLVAGMGDALSTWFEARSCKRTHSMNACGGYSTLAGLNLAKLCYDTILEYGPAAKRANGHKIITPALHHIVEANTLLSGIGFESSGLASAHAIHNGLSALDETHSFYHGEKVAFGVLAGLHLTDAPPAEMETVYSFCEKIGLPTTFEDIGLASIDKSQLTKVANKSCLPEESIHHEAGQITPEKVLCAMVAADAMGRGRKKDKLNYI